MKKKKFLNIGRTFIILNVVIIIAIPTIIYFFTIPNFKIGEYGWFSGSIFLIIFLIWGYIGFFDPIIIFTDEYIQAPRMDVQVHEVKINYSNISDIHLARDRKDSLDQKIQGISGRRGMYYAPSLYTFMVLVTLDGNSTRLCLYKSSDKKIVEVINELKLRIRYSGNKNEFKDTIRILEGIKIDKSSRS